MTTINRLRPNERGIICVGVSMTNPLSVEQKNGVDLRALLQQLEDTLNELENPGDVPHSSAIGRAQQSLADFLRSAFGPSTKGLDLVRLLEESARLSSGCSTKRPAAIVIARCIGIDETLVRPISSKVVHFRLVEFLEATIPDLLEAIEYKQSNQTFERIRQVALLNAKVRSLLMPLRATIRSEEEIAAHVTSVQKAVNSRFVRGFLAPYGVEAAANHVRGIGSLLSKLHAASPDSLPALIGRIRSLIEEARIDAAIPITFFAREFFGVYIQNIDNYLSRVEQEARGQFQATVECSVRGAGELRRR